MSSKNKEKLDSFVAYCIAHPDEKFWQALRNWSDYKFIFAGNLTPEIPKDLVQFPRPFTPSDYKALVETMDLKDTFYWE